MAIASLLRELVAGADVKQGVDGSGQVVYRGRMTDSPNQMEGGRVRSATDKNEGNGRSCGCESSLCDHGGACHRGADPRLRMEYVVDTCTQCAANMCTTGGASFITLKGDS